MSSPLLATYGTLMRAFGAAERLGVQDQLEFVAQCRWRGVLYDLGRFPGALPEDGAVQGELFQLSSSRVWAVLDEYEGYRPKRAEASLFVRRRVHLQVPQGREAWVYWFNGVPERCPRVPSGDWAAYVREGQG